MPVLFVNVYVGATRRSVCLHWEPSRRYLPCAQMAMYGNSTLRLQEEVTRWAGQRDGAAWRAYWVEDAWLAAEESDGDVHAAARFAVASLPPRLVPFGRRLAADGWTGSREELRVVCEALAGER